MAMIVELLYIGVVAGTPSLSLHGTKEARFIWMSKKFSCYEFVTQELFELQNRCLLR